MPQPMTPSNGARRQASAVSNLGVLRTLSVALGVAWSFAFVVIALGYELQMYGDGSIFSYAVAAQDSWTFHFRNISGRPFTYLASMLPAEIYVQFSRDTAGGIVIYGFLFYVAQAVGLAATWLADQSKGHVLFAFACISTAVLCPMVFGAPTELWMAHALFWPSLTVCHYSRGGSGGTILIATLLTMLLLTHEGGIIFALVILITLALRGLRDAALLRTVVALVPALAIWVAMKVLLQPDDYIASVLASNALTLINVRLLFEQETLKLALAALAGYGVLLLALRRWLAAKASIGATAIVAIALTIYWLWFDHALYTQGRYYLRTLLLMGTPAFGVLAALSMLSAEGKLKLSYGPRVLESLANGGTMQASIGALALVTLIHTVETAKFVIAWSHYKAAVQALAIGTASNPELGRPQFVSSRRIGADLNRLNWNSTTPYLSVIVSPGLAPKRLVVDPDANFFWLSCATATKNEQAVRAVPAASRELVRLHACLHR